MKANPESLAAPSEARRELLRGEFSARKLATLPGFLTGRRLDEVIEGVDGGEFRERDAGTDLKTELVMRPNAASELLMLLLNDPRLFALVEAVTGCESIGVFTGRTYRMLPEAGHRGEWHDDLVGGRRAALSVNLSREPFEGGVLEIRDASSGRVLHREDGLLAPGDAVIIGIEPGLQHRVTGLSGTRPKTAHVGFFKAGPVSPLVAARQARPVGASA